MRKVCAALPPHSAKSLKSNPEASMAPRVGDSRQPFRQQGKIRAQIRAFGLLSASVIDQPCDSLRP